MGVLRGLKWLYFGIFRVLKRHLIGWKRWYSHFMLKWLSNRKDSPNPNICTIYELNKSSYYKLNKIFHSQTMYDSTKKLLTTFYPIFWCSSNLYVKDWSFFETTSKMKIASRMEMTSKMRMTLQMKLTVKLSFQKMVGHFNLVNV